MCVCVCVCVCVCNHEPSGFEIEPRGFEDRTLLGSCLRTLLGSRSNPEGSIFEPSAFHEPRRVRIFEPFWVRDRTLWVPRTQRVRNPGGFDLRTLLGSWNPEGSRSNPEGFDLEPSGFEERTLWVRGTQRVRRSNPLGSISNPEGFEDTNPSGFVEPRGFEDRSLWVRSRTQRGSIFEPFWVRDRTQRGSIFEPSGFDLKPRGFVVLRR
ncbi:hypothetical protein ACOSQ4_020326 [Xanthoceras sorbifolium]